MTLEIRGRDGVRQIEARQDGIANALRQPNGGRDGLGIGGVLEVAKPLKNTDGGIDREDGHTLVLSVSGPLGAGGAGKQGWRDDLDHGAYIPDVCGALNHSGGHAYPGTAAQDADQGFLVPTVAWALQERDAKGPDSDTKPGHLIVQGGSFDQTPTSEDGTARGTPLVAAPAQHCPLRPAGGHGAPAVMGLNWQKTSMSTTLDKSTTPAASTHSGVRRLTPTTCERLQGFPDGWTLIPWRKGMAPDGPRYKALGNSMAVPVMGWIGKRIDQVTNLKEGA